MINNKFYLPLLAKIKANKIFFKSLTILILGIAFYCIPKKFIGETYPICLFRIILNKECIGCGTTRAIWSVLHFKFYDALKYNKLIIITFPLLIGCIIYWIFKKDKNNKNTAASN